MPDRGSQRTEDTRWTRERAQRWYAAQPWLVGVNYIPSDSINQLEMFQPLTWNAEINDRELALAASLGMNVVRVFLHDLLWLEDSAGFIARLHALLAIAERHGIRVMPVLFDSCWDPQPKSGPQRPPIPGVHNSGWVQSPGAAALSDPGQRPRLEGYIRGIVQAFADDPRVLAWDLWNEPDNGFGVYAATEPPDKLALVEQLLPEVFRWARSASPSQPLTSGVWAGHWAEPESEIVRAQLALSDVLTFHNYDWPEGFEARIEELKPYGRPILCTEYMARGVGSTLDTVLPIAARHRVAAISWGLVAGRTQTWLPWDSWQRPYVLQPPPVWFHDLLRGDGSAFRPREAALLKQIAGSRDAGEPA